MTQAQQIQKFWNNEFDSASKTLDGYASFLKRWGRNIERALGPEQTAAEIVAEIKHDDVPVILA